MLLYPKNLKAVVEITYSGSIELRAENVGRIFAAADVLKMNTLKVSCSDFIGETIDVTNWLSIVSFAKQQQSADLQKKAFDFALQNFEEVLKTEDFLQLTEEQLSELISSDDLCVDSEETVFRSVVSWVKYDKGLREKCMTGLLSHVRFSFLTPEFIIDNRKLVRQTYECLELLFSWLESHLSQTMLTKRHSERTKANGDEREMLGFVSGESTDNMKMQSLNPESNIWICEDLPPSSNMRYGYRAMVMNKKLIVAGGSLEGKNAKNIVESLDLKTKEWTTLPPMRQARAGPGMAELNGDLYIVGGVSRKTWTRSVEKYDFRTRKWQQMASMHSEQNYDKVTVLGELLYAMGDGDFPIECFDPADNKWTQLPHKNERSTDYGLAGVGGYLYAVGGTLNGQLRTTVERFFPLSNTWTVISPGLGLALTDMRCLSWNNRLIVCWGFDYENNFQNSVGEYDPEENEWRTLPSLVKHCLDYSSCSLFTFTK